MNLFLLKQVVDTACDLEQTRWSSDAVAVVGTLRITKYEEDDKVTLKLVFGRELLASEVDAGHSWAKNGTPTIDATVVE